MATPVGLELEVLAAECRSKLKQPAGPPSCESYSNLELCLASRTPATDRSLPLEELYEAIALSKTKPWPKLQLLRDAMDLLIGTAKGLALNTFASCSIVLQDLRG